jgi:hypothetical protein
MQMNSKMEALLHEIQGRKTNGSNWLSPDLRKLLEYDFVEEEGCIFLRNLYNSSVAGQLSFYPDRTGYECFVNHIHIDSYVKVDQKDLVMSLLNQGILYSFQLKNKLSNFYSYESFRIIVSFKNQECTVRFHKVRPNEEWLDENLEKYSEALMVIDSNHEPLKK